MLVIHTPPNQAKLDKESPHADNVDGEYVHAFGSIIGLRVPLLHIFDSSLWGCAMPDIDLQSILMALAGSGILGGMGWSKFRSKVPSPRAAHRSLDVVARYLVTKGVKSNTTQANQWRDLREFIIETESSFPE